MNNVRFEPLPGAKDINVTPQWPCVIFGSRNVTQPGVLEAALDRSGFRERITEVVCGMARGADLLGKAWADANGIAVNPFEPDWETIPEGTPPALIGHHRDGRAYYKKAGHDRNALMARYVSVRGGGAIGLWDFSEKLKRKGSTGTKGMIELLKTRYPIEHLTVFTADDWLECRPEYEGRTF